ncbi:MAG: hypothetical protein IT249_00145 [Chitinophagaceae bacterium]|nr:hypothetical protein [Chitinophagaceae bacterium]
MKPFTNRRQFIKMTTFSGAALSLPSFMQQLQAQETGSPDLIMPSAHAQQFVPNRLASWWCTIDDLLWPQKQITDKIKRRAEGFAKAQIDTAINFGFHNRFDFSNYFTQLHGYYANVCEELHKYGIRFMDHYSCNHVGRPRTEADFRYMHKYQRHGILLFNDAVSAKYAQYEGHFFNDLFEVDLRDGSHGYASQYQFEAFCHNNPDFLDMHKKYLKRLMHDVPFDAVEVDDMCSYPGNKTCGCKYCRDRFKKDYGHEIPDFSDKSFFGDTSKDMLEWGNYDNPAYRDWLRMKAEIVYDHVKMIKTTLGDKPLMTCCSNTGPIVLNAVALNLEKMAPYLDLFMLENVGTNIRNTAWMDMEAEALHQKDIAQKAGNAPAMALSYSIFEKGAYFGWALARFWGVANWSSTLNTRIEEDPKNALDDDAAITKSNNWEKQFSDVFYRDGEDIPEVRLVNNTYCKDNGWRDEKGHEHWDRSMAWTKSFIKNNIGYRFVRTEELADAIALLKEKTPLIMDGVACIADRQYKALQQFLSKGGRLWLSLPFGTHDEKGFVRSVPLSQTLLQQHKKNITVIDSALYAQPLEQLIAAKKIKPYIKQVKGDDGWTVRARNYKGKFVLHFMNTRLIAVPDEVNDLSGIPIMKDMQSGISDNIITYEINTSVIPVGELMVMSPEWNDAQRKAIIKSLNKNTVTLTVDLNGAAIYAVAQPGQI